MNNPTIYQPIPGVKVIGIGHKARQGKDVTATSIIHRTDGARRYSFADDLKAFARCLGATTKSGPILQALGTDVFRALNPDHWVRCLYWKIFEERPEIAVIPDVRFPNEVALVRSLGGKLIKVERLNPDGSQFISTDRDPNHPSETALDDFNEWDFIIRAQDRDLKAIYKEVNILIDTFNL